MQQQEQQQGAKVQSNAQTTYQETPYRDAAWEIIGEPLKTESFIPLTVKTVAGGRFTIDPMFPDYGGRYGQEGTPRPYLLPGEGPGEAAEEEEVEDLVKLKEEELAQMLQEAEARGRMAATEQLVEENERKMKHVEERLLGVFQDYQAQVQESLAVLERKAVDLSTAIAEKIIGYAVEINPEYLIPLVQEALRMVGSAHVSRVLVSPQDMEFIEVLGIQKLVREFSEFKFEPDDTIKAGCILETSAGKIDYELDKAFDRVKSDVVKAIS